jgi:NADH-quinone oxidoreductase subunit G
VRPDVPPVPGPHLPEDTTGVSALLATWRQLLDVGTLQRDEPELADTARPPVARIGKDTAARLGVVDGDPVTVTGPVGALTLPVRLTEMPDRVVWLPMRSPGSEVRAQLGAGPGAVVQLAVPFPTTTAPAGGAR